MRPQLPLLFLAASLPTADLAAQWAEVNSAPTAIRPYFRRAGGMAFDGAVNVLFGGLTLAPSPILNETWTWNGSTWTLRTPVTVPPARWGHGMVHDVARNRVVVFGGRSPTFYLDSNDTWEWTGTPGNWTRVLTPASPPPRHAHGMAFDRRRGVTVVFGGTATAGARSDTWEYDGTTWTASAATSAPPARECMAMTYDRGRGATLLFGGYDAGTDTIFGDTWDYDGRDWIELTPASPPTPRYRAVMVFDENRNRPVLYGGFGAGGVQPSTFEFEGTIWRNLSLSGSSYATEMYASFDPIRNRTYAFGGASPAGFSDRTWAYTGLNRATFSPYGRGCVHSAGMSRIDNPTSSPPLLGFPFEVVVTDIPSTVPFVVLGQGLDNLTWNAAPLPVDLTFLGMPGCFLEVNVIATSLLAQIGQTGTARLTIAIPNTPSLVNATFYAQALVPDPAAPNGLGGVSVAGRGILGTVAP